MTNKTLTAKVDFNTKTAESKLKRLDKLINNLNKAANDDNGRSAIEKSIERQVVQQNRLNKATRKTTASTSQLVNMVRKLSAAYLGIMGVRAVLNTSDTITSTENRLNNMKGGNPQLTQTSMDKIYSAAQRSRAGYNDMLDNVSKSMTLAGDSFGGNIDNAIRFQEIMSKAYTVGGASAAEQASSMYQLIQALGSGVLQGDELRSVREGAPLAYKAIEQFAQGVFDTDESLKELASQGKITSNIVVAAVMDMENGVNNINDRFANTAMTFAQAGKLIQNSAIQAFRPVLQMLNDVLNSSMGQAIINGIGQAFVFIANSILWVSNLLGTFFTWIVDNWNAISRVLMTVATIIGTVLLGALILNLMTVGALVKQYILMGIQAVISAIKSAISWMTLCLPLTIILALLALLIIVVIWVADSFADACGMIVGVITTAIAFVLNLIIGAINAFMQLAWTCLAEPLIGIIEWIANACSDGFNGVLGGIANFAGQLISIFLSLGKIVTTIIDAICGTNWTGAISGLQDKILAWGKKEDTSITISREAPKLNRIAYGDAYNTGYNWGSSGANWVTDKLSGISGIGDALKFSNDINTEVGGSYLPDINGAATALDPYNIGSNLDDINANTGAMKDSMDLNSEDLEYLRRIAETEWKKEFTTAEIKVEMNNANTINGDSDLDGIVTKLTDKLYEELNSVANGVYV